MTNQEAIKTLKEADTCFCKHGAFKDCHSRCKYKDALDIAIKALEQEPLEVEAAQLQKVYNKGFEDCRQAVIDSLHNKFADGFDNDRWWNSMSVLYAINKVPSVNPQDPKTAGYCKDCKWWKDKDGVFRRGIGAESKCPINRIEVFEGNGYCFLFEPQESEDKE